MTSLRVRLLVGMAVLVLLGQVVAAVGMYAALRSFLISRLDQQLVTQGPPAAVAVLGLTEGLGGGGAVYDGAIGGLPAGTYLALYSATGQLLSEGVFTPQAAVGRVLSGQVSRPSLPRPLPDAGTDVPSLLYASDGAGTRFRVLVESLTGLAGGFVVVAVPLTEVQSTLSQLVLLELVIGAIVILLVALFAYWIVRLGLSPLERMGKTAAAIAAGDLGRRVEPADEKSEIGRLGLALNAMLAQIEAAFRERGQAEQRLKRFVADAGHELRTPLTSIRGYAELMRRSATMSEAEREQARGRIEAESVRMASLIDEMLALARLDQGRPLQLEPLDLVVIARDAVQDARVTAPERKIELRVPTTAPVVADDARLRQTVANLVRNAVVHTPAGSPVEVVVKSSEAEVTFQVIDHGPGLAPAERGRIFEPFYRSDPARSRDRGGSGLGLAIASSVVASLGGKIQVDPTPGGGATFSVHLPRRSKPPVPVVEPTSN